MKTARERWIVNDEDIYKDEMTAQVQASDDFKGEGVDYYDPPVHYREVLPDDELSKLRMGWDELNRKLANHNHDYSIELARLREFCKQAKEVVTSVAEVRCWFTVSKDHCGGKKCVSCNARAFQNSEIYKQVVGENRK